MNASSQTQTSAPAVTPADSVRRSSYMAALALAEQIMSETLAMPTDFTVQVHSWTPREPELRFYFHRDLPLLRKFTVEQWLSESVDERADGSVYVESKGECRGVRVVAWTLLGAEDAAAVAA